MLLPAFTKSTDLDSLRAISRSPSRREQISIAGAGRKEAAACFGHHVPATRTIDIHRHDAHLRLDLLTVEDSSRGPQTSGYRGFLKETHLNIRRIEGLVFRTAILHFINQIILVHHLPVRRGAREVIAVYPPEKCSVIQHDSLRRLVLQIDHFLATHLRIRRYAVRIVAIAGIL